MRELGSLIMGNWVPIAHIFDYFSLFIEVYLQIESHHFPTLNPLMHLIVCT